MESFVVRAVATRLIRRDAAISRRAPIGSEVYQPEAHHLETSGAFFLYNTWALDRGFVPSGV